MIKKYSKERLVREYLEAETRRSNSKAVWFFLGGIMFGVVGGVLLSKFNINENWAIVPGSIVATVGIMRMLVDKSKCDETFSRMRDCADLSPKEFHKIRDALN